MANFSNPRKNYNFGIFFSGASIGSFLVQKVTLPDSEIEEITHGDTNHDIKTAGRVTYTKLVCEKLLPSNEADIALDAWHDVCQSSIIGGGNPPDTYKFRITIEEYAENGTTVLNTWSYDGAWPSMISGQEFDRQGSDNSIEKVEFSVDTKVKT